MAGVMFGMMWVAAPPIARFFAEPSLVGLTRFLGMNLIVNAFGLVQGVLLAKNLDFKTQSFVAVIATLISGALGVTLAWRGFGVWSLAAQSVAANALRVILYWCFNPWRPMLTFSMASLRSMFPYGSRLLASGMLNTIFENAYPVLIGKLYSKTDVGFYSRAMTTQRLPSGVLTGILSQVVSSFLCLGINTLYSGIMIGYPLREQMRDVMPSFLLAGAMAAAVGCLGLGVRDNLWVALPTQVLLGILIYAAGSAVLGLGPYAELKKMASGRLTTFKQMVAGS